MSTVTVYRMFKPEYGDACLSTDPEADWPNVQCIWDFRQAYDDAFAGNPDEDGPTFEEWLDEQRKEFLAAWEVVEDPSPTEIQEATHRAQELRKQFPEGE